MLRLPFKYYLSQMDEMARPAMKVTDEKGNVSEFEPISNAPYFMGKNDINYLYQFPPSLWPEAFSYRINFIFREFIEFLVKNEKRALDGETPEQWNDSRDVYLKWKGGAESEKGEDGGNVKYSKTLKYKFPNRKMYVKEYWDALQRDIDAEFFATSEDSPKARGEYEQILKKAIDKNVDTGGFIGTSLRNYTGFCQVTQQQLVKKGDETETKNAEAGLWACSGYSPISAAAISDEIGNWISAGHHNWGVSHIDPGLKKITIPNKGRRGFRGASIRNPDKLKSISKTLQHNGAKGFTTSGGRVYWPDVEKFAELSDPKTGAHVKTKKIPFEFTGQTDGSGVPGIEYYGHLPYLAPGFKVESAVKNDVDELSNITDLSEIPPEKQNTLLGADDASFESLKNELMPTKGEPKERLLAHIKQIESIREILKVINSPDDMRRKITALHEERGRISGGGRQTKVGQYGRANSYLGNKSKEDREKIISLDKKIIFYELLGKFKNWVDVKHKEFASYDTKDVESKYKAAYAQVENDDAKHHGSHFELLKQRKPNEQEEEKLGEFERNRTKAIQDLENLHNVWQFKLFTQNSEKIVPSNFLQLLGLYIRDRQLEARTLDAFSYAVRTHNTQTVNRNPLGLDMSNPLVPGPRKYAGPRDKYLGVGVFEPNRSSKQRLHATDEQWSELQKTFGVGQANSFPFTQHDVDTLYDAGRKYMAKIAAKIGRDSESMDFLGIDESQAIELDTPDKLKGAIQKVQRKKEEEGEKGEVPELLTLAANELSATNNILKVLDKVREEGSTQSAVLEGVKYAINSTGSDQIGEAVKRDPSIRPIMIALVNEIAKVAETLFMRNSGSGPLMAWLKATKNPDLDVLKKFRVYMEARRRIVEIVKNYIYTLMQLPTQGGGEMAFSPLELSRRMRSKGVGHTQFSALNGGEDGESDAGANMSDEDKLDGDSIEKVLSQIHQFDTSVVSIMSSSIFNNESEGQTETAISRLLQERMPHRRYRIKSQGGWGEGQIVGHDIDVFSKFLANKVKQAQKLKEDQLDKLKTSQDVGGEDSGGTLGGGDKGPEAQLLSKMNAYRLLYQLMELEVEASQSEKLDQSKTQAERDAAKETAVKAAFRDWVGKNTESNRQVDTPDSAAENTSPDLNDKTIKMTLTNTLNQMVSHMKEFGSELSPAKLPMPMRNPDVLDALEKAALVTSSLDEEDDDYIDKLDREIESLEKDVWSNDPNKEYKVNVALIATGGDMKYKQAARANVATMGDAPELTPGQIAWIQSRRKELEAKKDKFKSLKPTSHVQAAVAPAPVAVQPKVPEVAPHHPEPEGNFFARRNRLSNPDDEVDI